MKISGNAIGVSLRKDASLKCYRRTNPLAVAGSIFTQITTLAQHVEAGIRR
jgi:hypothetical protein